MGTRLFTSDGGLQCERPPLGSVERTEGPDSDVAVVHVALTRRPQTFSAAFKILCDPYSETMTIVFKPGYKLVKRLITKYRMYACNMDRITTNYNGTWNTFCILDRVLATDR